MKFIRWISKIYFKPHLMPGCLYWPGHITRSLYEIFNRKLIERSYFEERKIYAFVEKGRNSTRDKNSNGETKPTQRQVTLECRKCWFVENINRSRLLTEINRKQEKIN